MPGPLYQVGASATCPHGGQVTAVSSNTRVLAGAAVTTQSDTFTIAGCAFAVGTKPQPCVRIQWMVAALRVLVNNQPAILQTSTGICFSADSIPAGPPIVSSTQTKVIGQ